MKTATANDVARLAGVSRSAVSRAFSGNGFVSAEKREKILSAAAQLNYRPNALASSLASSQSNLVALILNRREEYRSPYFYNALVNAVQEAGLFPLVVVMDPAEDGAKTIARAFSYPVHGIIVMADSVHPGATRGLVSATRPIVLNSNWSGDDAVDAMVVDHRGGIFAMVNALEHAGHKTVAFIDGRSTSTESSTRRSNFINAVAASGLTLIAEGNGDYSYDTAAREAVRIIESGAAPDAFFCANDQMAFGVMDALRFRLGRRVPEDVSVIGYDGSPEARWDSYGLATIRQCNEDMVAQVVSLLTEPLDHPRQFLITTEFLPHASIRGAG